MHIGIVNWLIMWKRGGLEQVGANLANEMSARGHDVTVFYPAHLVKDVDQPIYPLAKNICCMALDLKSEKGLAESKRTLAGSGIDVLVALFSWRDLMWFPWLLYGTGIPLVCSEHNYPPIISTERWNPYEHFGCLAAADHIHVLLESYKPFYPEALRSKITAIPNCGPASQTIDWDSKKEKKRKSIIGAGRFVENHKQFSLLIKAFATLAPKFPDWDLILCGDGQAQKSYRDLIASLNVNERISMPGMVTDMDARFAESDIFCLPSRHEGFAMVILEAAAYALPIVAFAHCPGMNELIINNENGLLAPHMTAESLAETLQVIMSAPFEKRRAMGIKAQGLCVIFDRKKVFDQWEALLLKARATNNTQLRTLYLKGWDELKLTDAAWEIVSRKHPMKSESMAQYEKLKANYDKLLEKYKQTYSVRLKRVWKCLMAKKR